MTIGNRMKQIRLDNEMTCAEVGQVMGITHAAVSQIETGVTKNVRLESFLRFCGYFDADPYYIVFGKYRRTIVEAWWPAAARRDRK